MALTGFEVRVAPAQVVESRLANESPQAMTQRLALAKAKALEGESGLILGADTIVVDGDQTLGKPKDSAEAREMLESLNRRSHEVVTSIALIDLDSGTEVVDTCESRVPMRAFSDSDIERYLTDGNPFDKAGSYAIQDGDFKPVNVSLMSDCFANVMGLPLCHVVRNLPVAPPEDVPTACQVHTGYKCPIYQEVLEREL